MIKKTQGEPHYLHWYSLKVMKYSPSIGRGKPRENLYVGWGQGNSVLAPDFHSNQSFQLCRPAEIKMCMNVNENVCTFAETLLIERFTKFEFK